MSSFVTITNEHYNRPKAENKRLKELLQKLVAYADTSWYGGSSPKSDTARFYRAMRAIEGNIDQALQEKP